MRFGYVAGETCLDFVNTVGWRRSPTRWAERLGSYADLLDWAEGAGLLSSDRRRRLERLAEAEAEAATTVLVEARGLREAVARAAEAAAAGRLPAVADLEVINQVLRRGQAHLLLATTGAEVVWSWRPATPSLDEPLWPVARSAAELLTSDRRRRIGVCEDDECGWLYLDASRNRRRRWCSMDGCGSRNKARRYDRRRRGAGGA